MARLLNGRLTRTGPGRVHGCFWGTPVFGLFAVRDIWKLGAKIAPENENAFECDAGAKMSKFEAPIDVIGRRASLNKGES